MKTPASNEDPRVVRSKTLIIEALAALMQEKPYHKIKVQDISARAQLARQTFYLHFSGRDAVLLEYIDTVFEEFYQDIEPHIVSSPEPDDAIAWHMFRQWKDHAPFVRLIVDADVEHLLIKSFKNYITRIMGLYIRNHAVAIKDPEALTFVVDYLAGASLLILQRWVRTDFQYPLDKIAALYSDLTRPGVLQVLSQGLPEPAAP
ncbi:TetR/AcrR family transcriptional regulator [Parendozoicomonas haliclonae]|uniref:Bacterial regulatory protein, tetR family n=1 Tax=Parendozoicomonas haliclonae TaxID=1960125 RepID=A0A1X7AE07_9GAMM|nr:TetR/AcrR family transcriptional regulator [Parendozoicomonas haliclonae]SMA32733.1 Bacterial regulatory protein, tetR family [Parendozoicomonas haliclonae]